MEFGLLGPVEVRADGLSLTLGGTKPRTLLATLLLDAPHVVSAERLVAVLWESEPPATARTQIQGYVSALRKQFASVEAGREVIVTEAAGYRVVVRPGELDLDAFESGLAAADRALVEGRTADAAAGYRAGLGLWRGAPLGGVAETLAVARDRLVERRLAALEEGIDAELALGRHHELIPELSGVVAEHPYRERARGQLMLALYRAGRSADALAAYREGRDLLADELGLDPGPELQRLEHAILTADPELEPAAGPSAPSALPRPAQLGPDIGDFTGRDEQVETVCAALRADGRPAVPVVTIGGRAGVGKTALAVHAGHRVAEHYPDGQLHVNMHGVAARAADPSDILGRFLRALDVAGERIPESLEERAELYRSRLAGRRVLVVLDNAADEAQIRPLIPGEPGCAVLVTSRRRLSGLESAQLFDLDILDAAAAVDLLGSVAGPERVAAERAQATEIVRLCGYLPLAVRIAGAKLAARPHWSLARLAGRLADERHRLDELSVGDLEVRANVALSDAGLSVLERRAFHRLGLLDVPDVSAWVLAALADVSQDEAEDLADALVAARLLDAARRDGDPGVRYRMHDLLRLYARERAEELQTPAERAAAVRRAHEGWLHAAEEAGAALRSVSFGMVVVPVDGWRAEPGAVEGLQADPLGWFRSEWASLVAVVDQAHEQGWNDIVTGMSARLAPFLVVGARYDDWRHLGERSRSASARAGDRHGEAVALRGLGELALMRHRLDEAHACFTAAAEGFAATGDRHGGAVVASGLGSVAAEQGDEATAREHLEAARAALREIGDRRSEAWTLLRLGTLARLGRRPDEAAARMLDAIDVLGGEGSSLDGAAIAERLGTVRIEQGRPAEARAEFERALRLRRAHHDRFGEAHALHGLGEAHRAEGTLDAALDCLSQALRLWRELGFPVEAARALAAIGDVHAEGGDAERAAAARREAQEVTAGEALPGGHSEIAAES